MSLKLQSTLTVNEYFTIEGKGTLHQYIASLGLKGVGRDGHQKEGIYIRMGTSLKLCGTMLQRPISETPATYIKLEL